MIKSETETEIACPAENKEVMRSGTWATIRYAKRIKKPITIIWPDSGVTYFMQAEKKNNKTPSRVLDEPQSWPYQVVLNLKLKINIDAEIDPEDPMLKEKVIPLVNEIFDAKTINSCGRDSSYIDIVGTPEILDIEDG